MVNKFSFKGYYVTVTLLSTLLRPMPKIGLTHFVSASWLSLLILFDHFGALVIKSFKLGNIYFILYVQKKLDCQEKLDC